MAPPEVRGIVHEKPDKEHSSKFPHGVDGWYVGPALDLYQCYNVWICNICSLLTCDTLSWFPTKVMMPIASSNDLILASIQDILENIQNPRQDSSIDPLTDSHITILKILLELITGLVPVPKP